MKEMEPEGFVVSELDASVFHRSFREPAASLGHAGDVLCVGARRFRCTCSK